VEASLFNLQRTTVFRKSFKID